MYNSSRDQFIYPVIERPDSCIDPWCSLSSTFFAPAHNAIDVKIAILSSAHQGPT